MQHSYLDVSCTDDADDIPARGFLARIPQPMRQDQVPLPLHHLPQHQRVHSGPLYALGS
jgi:hypothetical protein